MTRVSPNIVRIYATGGMYPPSDDGIKEQFALDLEDARRELAEAREEIERLREQRDRMAAAIQRECLGWRVDRSDDAKRIANLLAALEENEARPSEENS